MKYLALLLALVSMTATAGDSLNITGIGSVATLTVPKSMRVFDIEVEGVGVLNPKSDITPEESVWMGIMLAIGMHEGNPYAREQPDFAGFIHLHHLERHFDKAKP